MKRAPVIHPFLITLYHILFLYAENMASVSFLGEVAIPALAALAATLLLYIVLKLWARSPEKAGVIASFLIVLFFWTGRIYEVVHGWQIGDFVIGRYRWLFLLWGVALAGVVYGTVKTRKKFNTLTRFLNLAAIMVIGISLGSMTKRYVDTKAVFQAAQDLQAARGTAVKAGGTQLLRDIYYIIPDGYASNHVLEKYMNYSNKDFTEYLTRKGFYVAADSHSNYERTISSVASSLNMEYINYLAEDPRVRAYPQLYDSPVFYELIANSKVFRFLKAQGYTFINFGSSYLPPTMYNRHADLNLLGGKWSQYQMILLKTTLLAPLFISVLRNDHRERLLWIFDHLEKMKTIQNVPGPKFVFVHMNIPHPPFVFDSEGREIKWQEFAVEGSLWSRKDLYVEQLIYLNKRMKGMIDGILAMSKMEPIIIIQGDHGVWLYEYLKKRKGLIPRNTWPWFVADRSDHFFKGRYGILNAYYLPGGGKDFLYPSITPVNTFRGILKHYFNADYEILPDRSYFSETGTMADLSEVTNEVTR
ncbi:MAG: hypothetical protein HYS56_03230 [Candidatus Omnitrophica bacterium]|nr:hypothetical protein [Candidatus Omnitrophota bacterium]